jgi:hypothetical protein
MKHIQRYRMFEAKKNIGTLTSQQVEWLNECTKGTWQVNPQTGLVDVKGDFDCSEKGLKDFKGVQFGVVSGNFYCHENKLTSLEGAPQKVGGNFWCRENSLTSLVGAPQEVKGYFSCERNRLTSLVGAPQKVGGNFWCYDNSLTSLVGAPQDVGGGFNCDAFETEDWSMRGWLELLKEGGETATLVLPILPETELDKWILKHPLDLDLLDGFPDIKAGVLQRTGLKDLSSLAKTIRKGIL